MKRLSRIIWKLKTAASKKYIRLQDRRGLYTYRDWIKENEPGNLPKLADRPVDSFSFLITHTQETSSFLANTLDALLAQSYPRWEVLLLHDKQHAQQIEALLSLKAAQDRRIHLLPFEPTGEYSVLLSEAISQAKGNWVGFLGEGDCLSSHALAALANYLDKTPKAEMVYTDEDLLAADGLSRHSPFFKPDWSPDLLLSVNYLSRAFCRCSLISAAAAEGKNPEDVIYRCAEQAQRIAHLPEILHHLHPGVANLSRSDDQHAQNLAAHLERTGRQDAAVEILANGRVRASWAFAEQLVSIIIPTRDHAAYLKRCLESLLEYTHYRRFEVILVENNSQEPETLAYYQQLRTHPQIRLIEHHQPFNYSAANNFGARHARGSLLVFLNNDIEIVDAAWLDELLRWAAIPAVGVVGAKLLYPDGSIQHAGIVVGMEGHASHVFAGAGEGVNGPYGSVDWYRNYSAVTGACMAIKKDVFESIGGFDESYRLVFSDVEICLRLIRSGYRVVYTPFARLIHHEGKTRSRFIPDEDILKGYRDFRDLVLQGDPYYNPGLSHAVRIPTFRRANEETPIVRLDKIVEKAYG